MSRGEERNQATNIRQLYVIFNDLIRKEIEKVKRDDFRFFWTFVSGYAQ